MTKRTNAQRRLDNARYRAKHPGWANQVKFRTHAKLKHEVFDAYGGKCVCCGETDLHFLTLDHVDGVVPERHRQADGRRLSGTAFLYRIRNEGYPGDVRILCWNCNCSYGYYGFCPHQPHEQWQRRYT